MMGSQFDSLLTSFHNVGTIRFSQVKNKNSAKICEIVAVAFGMLIGIFALFSGVIERQG